MYRDSQKNQEGYSLDLIKNIMQKYGVNAYEAAKLLSEGAGSTLNKYKDTILMDEVFDGPARSIGSAIDKRTLDPNQIFSSAFSSLYNQGGYVNGPYLKYVINNQVGLSMKRLKYPTVDLYLKEFNYGNTISANFFTQP